MVLQQHCVCVSVCPLPSSPIFLWYPVCFLFACFFKFRGRQYHFNLQCMSHKGSETRKVYKFDNTTSLTIARACSLHLALPTQLQFINSLLNTKMWNYLLCYQYHSVGNVIHPFYSAIITCHKKKASIYKYRLYLLFENSKYQFSACWKSSLTAAKWILPFIALLICV